MTAAKQRAGRVRCPATSPFNYLEHCSRPAGHDGSHRHGTNVWDAPTPAADSPAYYGGTLKIQAAARKLLRELGGAEHVGNVVLWHSPNGGEPMIQTRYSEPKPPAPPPPPSLRELIETLVLHVAEDGHLISVHLNRTTDDRWEISHLCSFTREPV